MPAPLALIPALYAVGRFIGDKAGRVIAIVIAFNLILAGVYLTLNALLPDYSSQIASGWTAIPAEVMFFLNLAAVDIGLPLVIAAYTTRFLIRRIPVVG